MNSWRKWFCFPLAPTAAHSKHLSLLMEKSRLHGTMYQTRSFTTIPYGEVAFTWYYVPNTLLHHNTIRRSRVYMVLRTKHAPSPQPFMEKSRLHGTTYQTRSSITIPYGEVAFTWYYVPNTLLHHNTIWRSRLVWSRARDWKSRNRQKRFKSSNLFFSATRELYAP